jgi:hypothetical protein
MSPTGPTARTPTDAWVRLPPAELLGAVQLQPTPNIPLASIRELLRPVHDDNGQLVDWVLVASGFEQHDAVSAYWHWRNTWRRHWPLGPISNVASLTEVIADIEHDLDRGLDRLLASVVAAAGRPVTVSVDEAPALITELVTVRLALSADDRTGHGIVDDMPARSRGTGLARTWVTPSRPDDSDASEVEVEVILTGTPTSAVVLRPDAGASGLVVLHGGPPHAAFVGVTAVDLRGETAVVLNERGMSLRLDLHEARPLSWLVPRSLRWHVRAVPIVTVWAPLFEGLGAALSNAMASGEPLVISGDAGVG